MNFKNEIADNPERYIAAHADVLATSLPTTNISEKNLDIPHPAKSHKKKAIGVSILPIISPHRTTYDTK